MSSRVRRCTRECARIQRPRSTNCLRASLENRVLHGGEIRRRVSAIFRYPVGAVQRSVRAIIHPGARRSRRMRWLAGVVLGLSLVDCAGDGSPGGAVAPQAAPVPIALVSVSGNAQRATILAAVPESLSVSVRDQYGRPLSGVVVEWLTDSVSGTLSPIRGVTDAAGRTATRWVFGLEAGAQTAVARVAGAPPLAFTDTATTAACPIPDDLSPSFTAIARTIAKLRAGATVTIVAIGSSSTQGAGASSPSANYPSRLAAELAARYTGAVDPRPQQRGRRPDRCTDDRPVPNRRLRQCA